MKHTLNLYPMKRFDTRYSIYNYQFDALNGMKVNPIYNTCMIRLGLQKSIPICFQIHSYVSQKCGLSPRWREMVRMTHLTADLVLYFDTFFSGSQIYALNESFSYVLESCVVLFYIIQFILSSIDLIFITTQSIDKVIYTSNIQLFIS